MDVLPNNFKDLFKETKGRVFMTLDITNCSFLFKCELGVGSPLDSHKANIKLTQLEFSNGKYLMSVALFPCYGNKVCLLAYYGMSHG